MHRIGRTGRLGQSGQALTFVTPRELHHLKVIQSVTKRKISRKPVPTSAEAIAGQQHVIMEKLVQVAESPAIEQYRGFARELLEETDSVTLLAAALKMLAREPETVPVKLTPDIPYKKKKKKNKRFNRRLKWPQTLYLSKKKKIHRVINGKDCALQNLCHLLLGRSFVTLLKSDVVKLFPYSPDFGFLLP